MDASPGGCTTPPPWHIDAVGGRPHHQKGTKSAKRLLRQRRAKERRFAADVNHCISKALVRKAKDTRRGLAIEDLTGICERTTVRKAERRAHHSWAFGQLRAFLTYKAGLDKRNRLSRDRFACISCGHLAPADFAAARNIAARGAAVMRPNAGSETALASRLL